MKNHPWLQKIHDKVISTLLPGINVTSIKFLKHDGSHGTRWLPIPNVEDENGNNDYHQAVNKTNCHHDYICLRTGEHTIIGQLGEEIEYVPISKNPKSSQQKQGRNGTSIVNIGGTQRFLVTTVVNDPDLEEYLWNMR